MLAVVALRGGRPSEHFSWEELTTTSTGLPNNPSQGQRLQLLRLADQVLEPLREEFGPIQVTSAYRSPAVNAKIGGSPTSAHMEGRAADLYASQGATHEQMATWLLSRRDLPLRQVIVERHTGHLHVEMQREGPPYRRQFLQTLDGRSYFPWEPGVRT